MAKVIKVALKGGNKVNYDDIGEVIGIVRNQLLWEDEGKLTITWRKPKPLAPSRGDKGLTSLLECATL